MRAAGSRHDCMTARAVVRHADAKRGRVELEFVDLPACRGCEGACMWRRLPATTRMRFATDLPLHVGDPVLVSLPERYLLIGAIVLHGLPMAALLLGALAGFMVTGSDLGSVGGAVGGVALAVIATPRLRRHVERAMMQHFILHGA
jgi:positive regulator of sigma E activity